MQIIRLTEIILLGGDSSLFGESVQNQESVQSQGFKSTGFCSFCSSHESYQGQRSEVRGEMFPLFVLDAEIQKKRISSESGHGRFWSGSVVKQ